MQEAIYEGKYFDLKTHLASVNDSKDEIKRLKKRADKGAFVCPYCNETLIIKSGDIREEHFSHRHSKSCEISVASEVYHKQVERESKKHSVIKEIIYDELKSQEKLKPELNVEYGYIAKASEKWKYYPDITINNNRKEIAITILTDVTSNKDEKLVKQIKNRNRYFKDKSMDPIWFVESAEQSVDMKNRVIHLWEAEIDIAIKTEEDILWENTLNSLQLNDTVFNLFNYYHRIQPKSYNVQSLYYVQSTDTNIVFTVHRFIKDEEKFPYRAFALNEAYQMNLSTALWTTKSLKLCDYNKERQQRDHFLNEVHNRNDAEEKRKQNEIQLNKKLLNDEQVKLVEQWNFESNFNNLKRKSRDLKKQDYEMDVQTSSSVEDMEKNILRFIAAKDVVSALEVSEYLVTECGASPETYSTGKYKIFSYVCEGLEFLVKKGVLELARKDNTNDRFYKVLQRQNSQNDSKKITDNFNFQLKGEF